MSRLIFEHQERLLQYTHTSHFLIIIIFFDVKDIEVRPKAL